MDISFLQLPSHIELYSLVLVTHQFAVSLYEPAGAGHQHPARVGDAQQGPHYGQTAGARREI